MPSADGTDPAVTDASHSWFGVGEQLAQPNRGLEAKLSAKQGPIARILRRGVRLVAFGQVHPDQGSPRTLPQWFGPDCREGGGSSASDSPGPGPRSQGVEEFPGPVSRVLA